jgi:hypothetical protein
MSSRMSGTSVSQSLDDSLTSIPSPIGWYLKKKTKSNIIQGRCHASRKGRPRPLDLCGDDETDTVTTRPLDEESESTMELSSQPFQYFFYPRRVSFQIPPPTAVTHDHTMFHWSVIDPDVVWWSKQELQNIQMSARQTAQEQITTGCYSLVHSALNSIQQQAKDLSNGESMQPLLRGPAAEQLLLHARHIHGLELFSAPSKTAAASHVGCVLAVQRGLSQKEVDQETRLMVLRKASLRYSKCSKAVAFLLARANFLEVGEMVQEELAAKEEDESTID